MEIMRVNSAIRALVQEGKIQQIYSAMQTGQAGSGMQTMNQSLYHLVDQRLITKELALQKSPLPDELQDMLIDSKHKKKSLNR
jgi:twitching motility protein PilT